MNTLSPYNFDYSQSPTNSYITEIKEVCLVGKNRLLVYGLTSAAAPNNRVFELHKLVNNSGYQVSSVAHLSTQNKDYIMRSCDYEGGSWFHSTRQEEEHAFFNPESNLLTINDGLVSDDKLISVTNSRRGHYVTATFKISTNEVFLGYADPATFWTRSWTKNFQLLSRFYHKFTRVNMFSADRIYYLVPFRYVFAATAENWITGLKNHTYASYSDTNNIQLKHIEVWYSKCNSSKDVWSAYYAEPLDRVIMELLPIESTSNLFAISSKKISTQEYYIWFLSVNPSG